MWTNADSERVWGNAQPWQEHAADDQSAVCDRCYRSLATYCSVSLADGQVRWLPGVVIDGQKRHPHLFMCLSQADLNALAVGLSTQSEVTV